MKAQTVQKGLQLGYMLFVNVINPADLGGSLIPFLQQAFARCLILRYPMSRLVQNAHQGLLTAPVKQTLPISGRRVFLERRHPAHGDQKKVPEWMHALSAVVPAERMVGQR